MRAFAAITLALLGLSVPGAATGGSTGTLAGRTEISFGCPGPVSPDGPSCNPWHAFPNARFSVSRRSTTGAPVPATAVVVTSNASARFSVRLDAGTYIVTPLPQHNARGGKRLVVRVRAGERTRVLVRFAGYPQME